MYIVYRIRKSRRRRRRRCKYLYVEKFRLFLFNSFLQSHIPRYLHAGLKFKIIDPVITHNSYEFPNT